MGHAEPPKRYKVQVEGKEVEVEEAELLRGYQRARAAQQRFDEAAKHRQRAEQALQALQKDPFALLSDPKAFGVDPDVLDQLAERRMLAKLESQMLTPEQKAQREKDARLAQFEAQEQERQQKEQARAHELAKTQARADLQRRFIEVLDKTGVPKSPQAVARMANYLREAKMKGLDPDLYDVAELVKEDFASEQRGLYGGLEGDALLQAVGPEVAEKIRKAHLAKLDGAPGFMKPSGQSAPPAPSREPERLDEESFSERIRRRAGF